ncbi:MAG: ABC transporter permease [Candidatus Moranbacteria bacterium]|nr:ABC transporter permease [Candidatus Moranbacteria bacterium]
MNNIIKKKYTAFLFAVRTIRTHKVRTTLALLGVVIGVFAVVVVTALGDGVKGYILGQVESFGSSLIQVEVKVPNTGTMSSENASGRTQGTQITTLVLDDREAIGKLPNVEATYAGTIGQEKASFGSVNKRILLFGVSADAPRVDERLTLQAGRFFTDDEDDNMDRVAVLGAEIKEKFFGLGNALGETITIKGEKYRVIGVVEPRGTVAFFNLDSMVYVPVQTLLTNILGIDYVQMISVKMSDGTKDKETVADMVALLRMRHDIDDPQKDDFAVTSTKEAQETLADVLGAVSILLLALTSISLVVGGVGIMNVMYVSVAERTSEIGLRKALGARSGNILAQFLTEAMIITGIGGIVGILLGVVVVILLTNIFISFGFDVRLSFSARSLFLGAGFSMAVGLLFGIAPALKAARLSPMEALRRD